MFAALILMGLGTSAVFLALETGEAAAQAAERVPGVKAVLESHEDLAETTRIVFSGLTLIFATISLLPRLWRRGPAWLAGRALPLAFLVLYGAGMIVLSNTAHNGGRLVHEFGVRAMPAPGGQPATALEAERD